MDYSRFLFKPFNKATYLELQTFQEFKFDCPQKEAVLDFMILMWDINSTDLKKLHPKYFERKRECALLAGLKLGKDNKFAEEIENIIVGANDEFNKATIRYLMMFGVPDYPALIAMQELQSQELAEAFKPTDRPKDRETMAKNVRSMTESLSEYERKIFGGEEVEQVRKALYQQIEKDKLRLRSEFIAEDVSRGTLDPPDPYEFKKQKPTYDKAMQYLDSLKNKDNGQD